MSTHRFRFTAVAIVTASLLSPARAQTLVFSSTPDPSEVVPPVASGGFGSGFFVLDREANTLTYRLTVRSLAGGETGAHLHGFAPAGQNAGELFTLPPGKTKAGVWSYPEALEEMLVSGDVYVDVHTTAFPGGEVRGQLVRRADDAVFTLAMTSAAAQASSPATGSGFLRANLALNQLRYNVVVVDLLTTQLQTHIHAGAPGVQGPVLHMLPAGNQKTGKWDYPETEEAGILAGDTYVNTHTQGFLGGEIRSQIERTSTNPSAYCAGKPNHFGCQPAATWSGTPTAGGADDLVVAASGLPSQLPAHFFWSASPKSSPFFGGTLCVRGPLRRTPLTTTGGSAGAPGADCTGAPSFFLSQAYLAQNGLAPGTLLYGQWWYLDPATTGPSGVGLTDAIQLEIRP